MARPKNADGQRTRQAILDAALDLFSERGFFGTSLRDIARTVGVRESALYNYFPSKDAKLRNSILVPNTASEEEIKKRALEDDKMKKWLEGMEIKKVVVVPKKLVNIVVK